MTSKPPLARFLLRLAAFVSVQLIIAAIVLWQGSPDKSNHYFSVLQDKHAQLIQTPDQRLIVLGGSNTAFGICSEALQQATGYTTINLGLHAALGLEYQLECVRQHGRRGDVVLVIAEYELLSTPLWHGEPASIRQATEQWSEASKYFHPAVSRTWKQWLDEDAMSQSHEWVMRAVDRLTSNHESKNIYKRSGFNPRGDFVAHHGRTPEFFIATDSLAPVDATQLSKNIESLNVFAEHCRARGITVCLTYPPMSKQRFNASAAVVQDIHQRLKAELTFAVLDCPDDYVFPRMRSSTRFII